MATYLEIHDRSTDTNLRKRLEVAFVKYAQYLRNLGAGATQAQQDWQASIFATPGTIATRAHAMALEAVLDPIIADAVNLDGIPDSGAGSIQAAVEAVALKY